MKLREEAMSYHRQGRPGKIEVVPTKPCATQKDLSLAYTPGVAEPCRAIVADPAEAFRVTARGNLVAVVTNGTAVLGLGRIGPLAGKPVMEGKGVLFKRFADIDVFDLELDTNDPAEVIRTVQMLEPTFGGVNLEDIAAPDCFRIERELAATMSIPIFHDDQHGTAIIASAALINGLELTHRDLRAIRLVICGAGAAGIATASLLLDLGMRKDQLILTDTAGVIHRGRDRNMNPWKESFATDEPCRNLAEALKGADVFIGVSGPGLVTAEMLRSMAPSPLILALANPDPEISFPEARAARSDAIIATGRSDYPNQCNNVLGFPFIFRGALDVQAKAINTEMKLAAVHALAELARQPVPETVCRAYGDVALHFGPDYIIPKPFDRRVLLWEASAVARAAMSSGAARRTIDLDEYRSTLEERMGLTRETMRVVVSRARKDPRRIAFPEGTNAKVLRAAAEIVAQRIARPVLLGPGHAIREAAAALEVPLEGIELIDPEASERLEPFAAELYRLRQRRGVTREDAARLVRDPSVFGALMLRRGDCDGLVSGLTQHYPDAVRPMLQIVGPREGVRRVIGAFLLNFRNRAFVLADATVNVQPDAETLAEIAVLTAELARRFNLSPRVAMLSFSNFGSVDNPFARTVRQAVEIVHRRDPGLAVEGEMQADTAVDADVAARHFPFSLIRGDANVLIFPDLTSGNIAYKLLHRLGGAEVVGPILFGMSRPVHILHQANEVADIVNVTALAVVDAQLTAPAAIPAAAGAFADRHAGEP